MEELTVPIKDIKKYLQEGYKVEVTSSDGWVNVPIFVEKGQWIGYKATNLNNKKEIISNEQHMFKTENGWKYSKDLEGYCHILSESGEFEPYFIEKLETIHRIVDIQVDHPNHRYFTNGAESKNTHVGKSLCMCSLAAGMYMQGANVLYISLEESEQKIRQRIDANIMNIVMDDLLKVDKKTYRRKLEWIKSKLPGALKIKEFPTSSAGASHFRFLINDYKVKENFIPDVVFIDYLNICSSDRHKDVSNSSAHIKAITEELRGLSYEFNGSLITGAQLNRDGAKTSDPGMTDVADSFASLFVADFVAVLTAPEELRAKNQMMWKQEKNRFKNLNFKKKFITGTDPNKMRVYDLEGSAAEVLDIDNYKSKAEVIEQNKTYNLINPETGEILEEDVVITKSAAFDNIMEE